MAKSSAFHDPSDLGNGQSVCGLCDGASALMIGPRPPRRPRFIATDPRPPGVGLHQCRLEINSRGRGFRPQSVPSQVSTHAQVARKRRPFCVQPSNALQRQTPRWREPDSKSWSLSKLVADPSCSAENHVARVKASRLLRRDRWFESGPLQQRVCLCGAFGACSQKGRRFRVTCACVET